jgi:hypothetical protein
VAKPILTIIAKINAINIEVALARQDRLVVMVARIARAVFCEVRRRRVVVNLKACDRSG